MSPAPRFFAMFDLHVETEVGEGGTEGELGPEGLARARVRRAREGPGRLPGQKHAQGVGGGGDPLQLIIAVGPELPRLERSTIMSWTKCGTSYGGGTRCTREARSSSVMRWCLANGE